MSGARAPLLSIVVASPYSIHDLGNILEALSGQASGGGVEIIVADCSQDGSLEDLIVAYPDVVFIRFPEKAPLPELWGAGIARSTGEIIAVTDSTCLVGSDWIAAMIKTHRAHRSPHPVIGGSVEPAVGGRWLDWAIYFCEYGQFMRPLKEGVVNELPGNNLSFKRQTLNLGSEFISGFFWKTYWCRELQAKGIELISAPGVVIHYRKSYRLFPLLVRRFHHGRCFAGMRVPRASVFSRAGYAAGSALLPLLFLMRLAGAVLPKRKYLSEFILSLPFTVLAIFSWSLGEFCGYLAGAGRSCDHIY